MTTETKMTDAQELLNRARPFLLDEATKYEDDGSNEPLELARDIESFLATSPSDESALSSASSALDGGEVAARLRGEGAQGFPNYERMFNGAVGMLAEISVALGIPDEVAEVANGNHEVLAAIEKLKARPEQQGQAVAFEHWMDRDWPLWRNDPDHPNVARLRRMWADRPQPVVGDAMQEIVSDLRHSAKCDGYVDTQARFLESIADRLAALSTQPAPFAHPEGTPLMPAGSFWDGCWKNFPEPVQGYARMLTQSWRAADSTELKNALEAGILALGKPAPSEQVAAATTGRLPPLPQAFFDEFGIGADDRVQAYARAAVAQCRPEQVAASVAVPKWWSRDDLDRLRDCVLVARNKVLCTTRDYQRCTELAERLGAMIAAAPVAPQPEAAPGVPEGFALVPVEPTEEMVEAYHSVEHVTASSDEDAEDKWAIASWGAMLAAAPKPTAGEVLAPRTTLYIDLDGVMADFDGSFPAVFGLDHRSMADEDMWLRINGHASFFRDLPLMAGAIEFFRSVEHMEPVILTACPKSNYAHVAGQKRAWVRQHLSRTCLVLPVLGGRHKALFMHQPGDVLIDDWGKNCDSWTEAGGIAIKHEGDWNATRAALTAALAQQPGTEGR